MSPEPTSLSLLERRRIEAEIVKPIYEALVREMGAPKAANLLREAIRGIAIETGKGFAKLEEPSLSAFARILPRWMQDDALQIELLRQSDDVLEFNVCRCRYAEMYRDLGLEGIGHILSCNRDGSFCEGYSESLELTRTQTIMEGAPFCDFRYRWKEEEPD